MMIGDVKRMVATFYGITRAEIEGPQLSRRFAWPRQVAMTMCRHYTRGSLPQIGRAFQRDHTTVLHAIRVTEQRITGQPDHGGEIPLLCAQIEAGAIVRLSDWAPAERARWIALPAGPDSPLREARRAHAAKIDQCAAFAAAAKFAIRAPVSPSRAARDLSGPCMLLLRGPDFFAEGVAA